MHRRSPIRTALFAALVAASPIAFYVAGRHSPQSIGQLLLAAWIYYAVWAIVLRSPIIAGVLVTPFVLSVASPAVDCDYMPRDTNIILSAVIVPTLGAVSGWICHALYVSRKSRAAVQTKPPVAAPDSDHSNVPLSV